MVIPIKLTLLSVVVSAIVAKAIAAYHFKVIDSYVKDMIDLAKKHIEEAYTNPDKRE